MRERFSVSHSKPPSILVAGIGTHGGGAGVLQFFQRLGWAVTAIDSKPRSEFRALIRTLGTKNITWKFGTFDAKFFTAHDVIVRNPGVPLSHPSVRVAQRAKKILTNDLDIFFSISNLSRVVGITGTKGKTTTALLTAHLLKPSHFAAVVGIPGISFFDALLSQRSAEYVIAECSSYDLELSTKSPHVALLTSLAGDHISRHGSMRVYANTKANLFRYQQKSDIALLPKTLAEEKVFLRAIHDKLRRFSPTPSGQLGILPWHIHPNSISAAEAIVASLGISIPTIARRLQSFRGAPGRRERVHSTECGAVCINDTTATAPIAAIDTIQSGAEAFGKEHIIAIVGGHDKELREGEIRTLARVLRIYTKYVVLLDGSFTKRLMKYLPKGEYRLHTSMKSAVKSAMHSATKHDRIILSPGCASFNMFMNEFDRGDQFEASVLEY